MCSYPFGWCKRLVLILLTEKRRHLAQLVEIAKQKERLQVDLLHRSFERAENQLQDALQQRKQEVKVRCLSLINTFWV